MTMYQYNNYDGAGICIHCGYEYNEHGKELECPKLHLNDETGKY